MEIESKNGSKILLQEGSENIDFGRGLGFNSTDLTVSRRHISFELNEDRTGVYFQVKGKNPVWVHDSRSDEIRVYRRSEKGDMKSGDSFCVSSKNAVWFNLKRIACEDEDEIELRSELRYDDAFAETSGIDYVEIETGDISQIDPVKEFNFVVMGHEFDCYPKKMIRDVKNWDWFLEEPKEESEDDEISERKRKGIRRKRKKGGGESDDDAVWTGESEEEAETIKKLRKVPKPNYSTRSKNREKNKKGMGASKSTKDTTKRYAKGDEDEVEDEEDEVDDKLGGFIVDDEDIGEEGIDDDEEEEEEEEDFEEDEYDEE